MRDVMHHFRRWSRFCADLSRRHRGWFVTVEVSRESDSRPTARSSERAHSSERKGCRVLARRAPLAEVAFEQQAGVSCVRFAVVEPDGVVARTIVEPRLLRLEKTAEGAERGLTIRSASGEVFHLWFLTPHFPRRSRDRPQGACSPAAQSKRQRMPLPGAPGRVSGCRVTANGITNRRRLWDARQTEEVPADRTKGIRTSYAGRANEEGNRRRRARPQNT